MNNFERGQTFKKKYRNNERVTTNVYRAYVIISLLLGLCSILMITFIYFFDGGSFWSSLYVFAITKAAWILLVIAILTGLYGWLIWVVKGTLENISFTIPPVVE
jgi:membrane protein YdbS with pleckstrin-like domain